MREAGRVKEVETATGMRAEGANWNVSSEKGGSPARLKCVGFAVTLFIRVGARVPGVVVVVSSGGVRSLVVARGYGTF